MTKRIRLPHVNRIYPARVFRVRPSLASRIVVEVHLTRNRRQMRWQTARWRPEGPLLGAQGAVVHYYGRARRDCVKAMEGRCVARMFLNQQDLACSPALIIAHEALHAAMAWTRYNRVDVDTHSGEEALAEATGELTQQISNRMWGNYL